MLKPVEFQTVKPVTLRNGDTVSNSDVWEILCAARDGDLEKIKRLTKESPGLISCEFNYTPPIHFAVREGHTEVTRFLLNHMSGHQVNGAADPASYRSYPFQDTLLTIAREREHEEVAALLIEYLSRRAPVVEGLEEFFKACRDGELSKVQAALEQNNSLAGSADDTGDTALHQAVEANQLDVVNELLDRGASADAKRADGVRPINLALRKNNRPLAEKLLARGAEYNIYIAACFGDFDYISNALANDPSLANFEDSAHVHPLTAAVDRKDMALVKLLLDHGANPSLPEEGAPLGQPLWKAVYTKQHEIAKLLLEHGANPNTAPESSGPAIMHARGDEFLTKLLIDYGADTNASELREFELLIGENKLLEVEEVLKRSPELMKASEAFWAEGILAGPANGNRREMIELLMRYGATVPDASKWGPYYYFKHYETAKLLLERGMNPNHTNWHHVTMLHYMAQQGEVEKAKLLLDYGADIDAVDEEYQSTPLGFAARWGRKEIASLLIERGADVNKSGARWSKPLVWARKKRHHEIEAMLLASGARKPGKNA